MAASTTTETALAAGLAELLAQIKFSTAQLKLYPRESPQVQKAADTAAQAFTAWLDSHPALTLAATPQGLLVDGKRLGAKDFGTIALEAAVVSLLLDASLRSVTFRRGLAAGELLAFLDGLARKFGDLKDGKEINRLLRDQLGVRSIAVDEVAYVAVAEGDLLIKDAARTLENGGTQAAEILLSLERLAESSLDERVTEEARLRILQKLLEQDPTLLRKARAEGIGRPDGEGGGGNLTLDRARAAVGEIARLLPDAPYGMRDALRRVGEALAGAFGPAQAAILRAFLRDRTAELVPKLAAEALYEAPAVARARTLLAADGDTPPEALLKEAGSLLRDLLALERSELAAQVLARVSGLLLDRQPSRRLGAAEALLELRVTWSRPPLSAVRDGFEGLVRSSLEEESDARVYAKSAELAVLLTDERLRRGELEAALETLCLFKKHHLVREASQPQRGETAFRCLERLAAGGTLHEIARRLRQGDPVAIRTMEALDEAAARHLIAEIRRSDGAAHRIQLAEILARIGPRAGSALADEARQASAPSDALRLLEALPHAAPESVASVALGSLLRHPALAVRRRAAALLGERAYDRSGELLLSALREEKEASSRVSLVEALGRLKHGPAREILEPAAEARSETDEVRAAACGALARFADPASIPVLVGLCARSPRGITGILRPTPAAVRSAALRALSAFAGHPAAREALRKATEDSDGQLQAIAREVLYAPIEKAVGDVAREVRHAAVAREVKALKLAGALQEIPLDQVCQLIGSSEKTGLLALDFEGRPARVWFEDGMVTAADFESRQDQEAFNAFIRLKKGQFLFQPGEIAPKRRLRSPVAMVLLEACRLADESC
jgi:hypothetical protein